MLFLLKWSELQVMLVTTACERNPHSLCLYLNNWYYYCCIYMFLFGSVCCWHVMCIKSLVILVVLLT